MPISFNSAEAATIIAVRRTNTSGSSNNYVRFVRMASNDTAVLTNNETKSDYFAWLAVGR